jgi:hypothetical protein
MRATKCSRRGLPPPGSLTTSNCLALGAFRCLFDTLGREDPGLPRLFPKRSNSSSRSVARTQSQRRLYPGAV